MNWQERTMSLIIEEGCYIQLTEGVGTVSIRDIIIEAGIRARLKKFGATKTGKRLKTGAQIAALGVGGALAGGLARTALNTAGVTKPGVNLITGKPSISAPAEKNVQTQKMQKKAPTQQTQRR